MDFLKSFLTYQWQRKLVALLSAAVLWIFVSQSITDKKTISGVPIRVINLPEDKTIPGMQPNGIIGKRVPLTLQGSKSVIDVLETGDLEVLLDASMIQQNDWVVQISKKNLVSLNPAIDLARHISEVSHPEFVLRFSQIMTGKVPIRINAPSGHPPPGYEFLDIWPLKLTHTVVGPKEQVEELVNEGLDLVIDMSMISKADLDKLKTSKENFHDDEILFFIPPHWRKINLPFKGGISEEINDTEAQNLHIDFMRREYLPLAQDIPVRVFYPFEPSDKINPITAPLLNDSKIKKRYSINYLSMPLLVYDVSPLFLEIIEGNLEIVFIASNSREHSALNWSLQVIDPHLLEDRYLTTLITKNTGGAIKGNEPRHSKKRELHLRNRFKDYLHRLTLYTAPDKKLQIDVRLTKEGISAIPSAI